MVEPLSYFSFQPVLHDWYNKGCGVYYSVYWITEPEKQKQKLELGCQIRREGRTF